MKTFDSNKSSIALGDHVIVYFNHYSTLSITVKKDEITQTKFGAIKHNDLVNHKFGTKFKCSKGWVYVLNPTPELWTVSLPHRTQILYATDIAMVLFQLEILPGSIVCESGTGSGSLSHSILRAIAPSGHLHTVEFHEERSKRARQEFVDHGYANNVTVYHRDVYAEGFPIKNAADAVFLDVPKPQEAFPHAVNALKKSGSRFCSFSPCMEQVERTCALLHKPGSGFHHVQTIELVKRSHNVKRISMPVANMGEPRADHRDPTWPHAVGDHLTVGQVIARDEYGPSNGGGDAKKAKMDDASADDKKNAKNYTPPSMSDKSYSCRVCVQPKEIYGHTGYLTFATYQPDDDQD